jgi:hypothetical protein
MLSLHRLFLFTAEREGIEKKDAKGIIGTMYQNGLPDDIRVYSILNGKYMVPIMPFASFFSIPSRIPFFHATALEINQSFLVAKRMRRWLVF